MPPSSPHLFIAQEVLYAQKSGIPVVALESTVITHGLPHPQNLSLAQDMEKQVRAAGAVPATVGVLDGQLLVGLNEVQLERLASGKGLRKISGRDLGTVLGKGESGGTTVAGTLVAAKCAGLRVFATGGIGGVHRGAPFDISADLPQLSHSPLVVVCAGAKAILDLSATIEYLETLSVPVVGYQTDEFPAFYARSSGLPVSARADSPEEVANIAKAHWGLGLKSAVLLANPPPEDVALVASEIEGVIQLALEEAQAKGISGQEVSPFLLQRVSELSGGESLRANLGLLKNNAKLAAQIAQHLIS